MQYFETINFQLRTRNLLALTLSFSTKGSALAPTNCRPTTRGISVNDTLRRHIWKVRFYFGLSKRDLCQAPRPASRLGQPQNSLLYNFRAPGGKGATDCSLLLLGEHRIGTRVRGMASKSWVGLSRNNQTNKNKSSGSLSNWLTYPGGHRVILLI